MPVEDVQAGPLLLPLGSPEAALPLVGGKAANLAVLVRGGFRVPDGFVLTTNAYRAFVRENQLQPGILTSLGRLVPDPPAGPGCRSGGENRNLTGAETGSPDGLNGACLPTLGGLEEAARQIRGSFAAARMPEHLAGEILAAYGRLGRGEDRLAVAVRSSATAEDLPGLSFAGQQDTYLNVVGGAAVLRAVTDCWSSLWTARAIGYRARNRLDPQELALAVIVQLMVESEASGVLFTANPLTGLRSETVIDATLGLGEGLVSGLVEPDHFVVDTASGRITGKTLGAKAIAVRGCPGGGTSVTPESASARPAVSDEEILALAAIGAQVAALFGDPQDIEWAREGGELYLLQSRPITSLFPLPSGMPPEPLRVMFSFAAVQGLMDPMTPLGRDIICWLFAMGGRLFGARNTAQSQTVLRVAGERLWVDFTTPLRNSAGRKIAVGASGLVEPTIRQAVAPLLSDPRLNPSRRGVTWRGAIKIARFALPLLANVALNLAAPERRRAALVEHTERILENMRDRSRDLSGSGKARLSQVAALMGETLEEHLPPTFIRLVAGVASGMASLNFINQMAKSAFPAASGWSDLVLEVTRGLPHNPTTEMDLALWKAAVAIRDDVESRDHFLGESSQRAPAELVRRYQSGRLPPVAQRSLRAFLERYGGRGLAELDTGRARWSEDPAPVLEAVASYLRIADPDRAPDRVFARGAVRAEAAVNELVAAVRKTRHGRVKARMTRFAVRRARTLLGLREVPKFFAVRLLGVFRAEVLTIGEQLVSGGELDGADDLFYLNLAELRDFASGAAGEWRKVIAIRRDAYRAEMRRRQLPRLLLSDGRAFYDGMNDPLEEPAEGVADAGAAPGPGLFGSPVSPGIAEGQVRIVLDPRRAGLLPGEIMVCPGTDPSWTPLFLTAAGLVMEVGGMMTHGAVVAREYGIPAVVGVSRATERLVTGQRVRVNGSSGRITLVHDAAP